MRIPEIIARRIEEQIADNRLKPGETLPPEAELMTQFGVGRYTIREALRVLEASGLITVQQGSRKGPVITHVTTEFISNVLLRNIRLGRVSAFALYQFRLAFEPSMAEIVASQEEIDPQWITRMENNILEAERLRKANKVTGYTNVDFHVLLASATANPLFIANLMALRNGFDLITPAERQRWGQESEEYHRSILEAVKRHEPEAAKEFMCQHLLDIDVRLKREPWDALPIILDDGVDEEQEKRRRKPTECETSRKRTGVIARKKET